MGNMSSSDDAGKKGKEVVRVLGCKGELQADSPESKSLESKSPEEGQVSE